MIEKIMFIFGFVGLISIPIVIPVFLSRLNKIEQIMGILLDYAVRLSETIELVEIEDEE